MNKGWVSGIAVSLSLMGAQASQAALVFSDNFNSTTSEQLNQTAFTNWTVTSGSVDVIGDGGSFAFLPVGNGNYVDLNGSTGQPGQLTTKMTFGAGTYIVSFDLAGSHGGSGFVDPTDKTTLIAFSIGGATQSLTLKSACASDDPFVHLYDLCSGKAELHGSFGWK